MDELTLLRSLSEHATEPDDSAVARSRAALFERIQTDATPAIAPARPRPRRQAWRWTAGVALTAGVLAAALVVTDVVGLGGGTGGAEPAAAAVLHEAALQAVTVADPVVLPGQYLRIQTDAVISAGIDDVSYLTRSTSELYVPADRDDAWVWVRPLSTFYEAFTPEAQAIGEADAAARAADPEPGTELLRAEGGRFYGSDPPEAGSEGYDSLPWDPRALLNHIYDVTAGTGPSPDGEALVYIADKLRQGTVPADLRAALFEAAALIPGVSITEEQAALDGRIGVAIGRDEPGAGQRQDIIIEPSTGQVIGERHVQLVDGVYPAGTAVSWTAVTTTVVDSAPEGGTPNGYFDDQGCEALGDGQFQC
jgi:hypothetical protein